MLARLTARFRRRCPRCRAHLVQWEVDGMKWCIRCDYEEVEGSAAARVSPAFLRRIAMRGVHGYSGL